MSHDLHDLLDASLDELVAMADEADLRPGPFPWREGLLAAILDDRTDDHHGAGVLEVHGEGFGFLRSPYDNLLPGAGDIYVSQSQIKRFELRTGDTVLGRIRPPKEQERYPALLRVELVDGDPPDRVVPPFGTLRASYPTVRLPIARDPWLATVDWVAPLGLGARGLLRAPNRSPRGEMMRRLARLFADDDRFEVQVLLPGERPEEVALWQDAGLPVLATPVEEAASKHLHVADIAFERARRMAERGSEVLLLVDGLTRLLRYALADAEAGGRQVDGLDAGALLTLRRHFATGRDLDEAGSVTLVAVVDEDDPLGVPLRRDLADLATWQLTLRGGDVGEDGRPALDIGRSWTRHEEQLVGLDELERRRRWRADLGAGPADEAAALAALFRPSPVDDAGVG